MDVSINWLRFKIMVVLFLAIFLFMPWQASAQSDLQQELGQLKQRIEQLEKKIQKAQEERSEIKEESKELKKESKALKAIKEKFQHLSIGGGVTGIIQSADADDDWDPTDSSYSADLEIGIDMDRWGSGFIHLETGDGANITDEVACLTGTNADAMPGKNNDLEVSEALWSFGLLEDKLRFTAGKLDPVTLVDYNEVAKDETTQFMADIFVDQLCMEWPDDYTPGFQAIIAPHELIDFKLTALSADTDWEDTFEHMFYAGEIALHPDLNSLKGNYRVYGWCNDRDHVEWDDVEEYTPDSEAELYDEEENYGFGASIDQQVTPDITLFARYGWQDDDIAAAVNEEEDEAEEKDIEHRGIYMPDFDPYGGAIEQSVSCGGEITGERWSRPNDVLGVAFGVAILNDDFEDYVENEGIVDDTEDEYHYETYYSCYLNEYVSISPDFQVIDNPNGNEDRDEEYIAGLRTQLSF